MSKINENENVEIQAVETEIAEVKPEGFFAKAGQWIAKHKKGIAITAVAGTVVACIVGVIAKKAREDDADEIECEEDDFVFEDEPVDTEE